MRKCNILSSMFVLLSFFYLSYRTEAETSQPPQESEDFLNTAETPEEVDLSQKNTKKRSTSLKTTTKKSVDVIKQGSTKEIEVNSFNFIRLTEKADEIFIPDPNIIDVQMLSDNSLYLVGLAPGVTALVINGKRGNILVNCKIKVTYPLKAIKDAIKEMYPDTDVEILSLDKSVILRGRVPSPQVAADVVEIASKFIESDNIVNKLTIETATQVLLKVKIAEVTRDVSKSMGIHWRAITTPKSPNGMAYGFSSGNAASFFEAAGTSSSSSGGSSGSSSSSTGSSASSGGSNAGGNGSSTGNTSTSAGGDVAGSAASAALAAASAIKEQLFKEGGVLSSTSGGHWMIYNGGQHSLAGLIDALASETYASILAEPTLVAMSGSKAEFKSGGEYGYRVVQPGESSTATTEFKEWGTSIEFTPVVISEDRINITVTPKVSTLTITGENQPPSLSSKEATTTIELGSGQSFAIAGLLQTDTSTAAAETPILADIPLFGALFRSSTIHKKQMELVIIVTPYIVKPSSKPLRVPTDMVPRLFSPLESILTRKFHKKPMRHKSTCKYGKRTGRRLTAGFSLK